MSAPPTPKKLLTERRGPILVVTVNRPEVRNACDDETSWLMNAAMDELDADHGLSIGIVTGAGGNFSAGADLKALARGEFATYPPRGGFGVMRRPPRKPLIAAVEGVAMGGGLELCLACDLIVAARDARMGIPEVRHNVLAMGGGLIRLPRRVPYHIAMELALSGAIRDAEYFARWGFVNSVVEPGQALAAAIEMAERLLVNGPTALAASKEIIYQTANWTEDESWDAQMPIGQTALESEDYREGVKAFAEKRKPVWKGR